MLYETTSDETCNWTLDAAAVVIVELLVILLRMTLGVCCHESNETIDCLITVANFDFVLAAALNVDKGKLNNCCLMGNLTNVLAAVGAFDGK